MKFFDSLEKKGRYSTLIGIILGIGTTLLFLIELNLSEDLKYIPYAVGFGFSLGFLILPSSILFMSKIFKFEVKD